MIGQARKALQRIEMVRKNPLRRVFCFLKKPFLLASAAEAALLQSDEQALTVSVGGELCDQLLQCRTPLASRLRSQLDIHPVNFNYQKNKFQK